MYRKRLVCAPPNAPCLGGRKRLRLRATNETFVLLRTSVTLYSGEDDKEILCFHSGSDASCPQYICNRLSGADIVGE
jgi:hypothetical protein